VVEDRPYTLSLAPYGYYWFTLRPAEDAGSQSGAAQDAPLQEATVSPGAWATLFDDGIPSPLLPAIRRYMSGARWFGGKARTVQGMSLLHSVPVSVRSKTMHALFLEVAYTEGEPDTYFLPVSLDTSDTAEVPAGAVCLLRVGAGAAEVTGTLRDALEGPEFPAAMLSAIGARRSYAGESGARLSASAAAGFRKLCEGVDLSSPPKRLAVEQSNTSELIDNKLIFKFYRRISPGVNPDYEIGKFLTEQAKFQSVSPVAGTVELVTGRKGAISTVAILQKFIDAQGDAWQHTMDTLRSYGERWDALTVADRPAAPQGHLLGLAPVTPPDEVSYLIGPYLESARLLGERTAQLHAALARGTSPEFAPEPFTSLYQRALYQGMRNSVRGGLRSLRAKVKSLPEQARQDVDALLEHEPELYQLIEGLLYHRMSAERIRIHGDYHLGQVLYTGADFVIIDFEGEPARPLSERRIKRSPLRDVAGMVRSFHYASIVGLADGLDVSGDPQRRESREAAGAVWRSWVSAAFLNGYRTHLEGHTVVPQEDGEFRTLLDSFMVQKAVYEVEYELNNRPAWVGVPVKGLLSILGQP
jgi:maltose alpha-D-glucosyltransferase/alpha-amylase